MKKYSIAACVTLYNPEIDVVEHIESYIKYVDELYILNNQQGENVIDILSARYSNIQVINYSENMGLAKPMNDVLFMINNKYDFLLTMDQDSYFPYGVMENYLEEVEHFNWDNTLGVAPNIIDYNSEITNNGNRIHWTKKYKVITSGNIINVKKAVLIGGFNEKLFIDEVDNEFCLRGYKNGFYSYQCEDRICLCHQLGNPREVRLLGIVFHPPMHNYIRTYYIFRNRIYTFRKYWNIDVAFMFKMYIYSSLRMLVSKMFFEEDRKRKTKSIIYAIRDFVHGKMGKKEFNY